MKTAFAILILFAFISFETKAQVIKFEDLLGGKWKHEDLPDSVKWYDGSLHLCPSNPSFWFKDSLKIDVVWNGFYFADQKYLISKNSNSIFVYVDSIYENVSGFACIFKPIKNGVMKMQYSSLKLGQLQWIKDETWYNTFEVYRFAFRSK